MHSTDGNSSPLEETAAAPSGEIPLPADGNASDSNSGSHGGGVGDAEHATDVADTDVEPRTAMLEEEANEDSHPEHSTDVNSAPLEETATAPSGELPLPIEENTSDSNAGSNGDGVGDAKDVDTSTDLAAMLEEEADEDFVPHPGSII